MGKFRLYLYRIMLGRIVGVFALLMAAQVPWCVKYGGVGGGRHNVSGDVRARARSGTMYARRRLERGRGRLRGYTKGVEELNEVEKWFKCVV